VILFNFTLLKKATKKQQQYMIRLSKRQTKKKQHYIQNKQILQLNKSLMTKKHVFKINEDIQIYYIH